MSVFPGVLPSPCWLCREGKTGRLGPASGHGQPPVPLTRARPSRGASSRLAGTGSELRKGLSLLGPASACQRGVREGCPGSLPCPALTHPGSPQGLGGRAVTQVPSWAAGTAWPTLLLLLFLPANTPSSPPHTQCFSLQPSLPEGSRGCGPRGKSAAEETVLRLALSHHRELRLPSGLAPRPPRRGHGRCPCARLRAHAGPL